MGFLAGSAEPWSIAFRPGKYAAYFEIAARQSFAERGTWVARSAVYVVILLIFSRLWIAVGDRIAIPGVGFRELVWYLAITEWIVLAQPLIHLEIEQEVRRGDVACLLPRPASYLWSRVAEGAGDLVIRAVTLGVTGFVAAFVLAGGLPSDPSAMALAIPLGLVSGVVGLICVATIGLSTFWLQEAGAVYLVWQKCAFILGGLFLPLSAYPEWLQSVAAWTPFAAMIYGPARLAFGWQPEIVLAVSWQLVAWLAIAVTLAAFVHGRALRRLDVNGG